MVKNNQRADRGKNRKTGNAPKLTAEQKRQELIKQLRLKPNTIAMLELMENNPKLSQTEAYKLTHKTDNNNTAAVEASRLLRSPNVQIYKDSAIKKAKRRIVQLVDSDNEQIAIKASQDILDRTEGKAAQKTEHTSRTVEVHLDLTGVKLGNHYLTPRQLDGE